MNYGDLKAAVAAYAHRTDLAALYDTFLALAEERIYTGEANSPKVRAAVMRQTLSLPDGTRPAGFLEAVKVAPDAQPDRPLEYRPMEYMPSPCRAFSWDGATLVLSSDQSFPVDMTFYARLTTPVADSDTNWILTNHPRVYLFALLVEVGMWSKDDALAAQAAANFISAATALNSQERAAETSGSKLIMRSR